MRTIAIRRDGQPVVAHRAVKRWACPNHCSADKQLGEQGAAVKRIKDFVEQWYGRPFTANDGIPRASLESSIGPDLFKRLPQAVVDWYELAGARFDLPTGHIHLERPDTLEVSDGFLLIYSDPHGGVLWGVRDSDFAQQDPPVVFDDPVYPAFTEFLYALLVHDRLSPDECAAEAPPIPRQLIYGDGMRDAIARAYPVLQVKPIVEYPVPAGCTVELFGSSDVLAVTDGPNWATITARTAAAWTAVAEFIRKHGGPGNPIAHADWLSGTGA
jgi:hypothetical protein